PSAGALYLFAAPDSSSRVACSSPREASGLKLMTGLALVVFVAAICAAASNAETPLTKMQYLAKLRAANAQAAEAENAALASSQSKSTTASYVKTKFKAWGETESTLGRSFAALTPPAG